MAINNCGCGCGKPLRITRRNQNNPPTYLQGHANHLIKRKTKPTIDKFNDRVNKSGDCWEWEGFILPNGYGQLKEKGKNLYAHRFSYSYFKGEIPSGLYVLHKCDNRKCVNPDHLFLGTAADNTADMDRKGRRVSKPGTQKISRKDAENIRILNSEGFGVSFLSEKYDLKPCTIRNIIAGRLWKVR